MYGIFTYIWVILFGKMLVNISAPWFAYGIYKPNHKTKIIHHQFPPFRMLPEPQVVPEPQGGWPDLTSKAAVFHGIFHGHMADKHRETRRKR